MPYPNEHAVRLRDPGDFESKTFRRTKGGTIYGSVRVPSTVSVIWGKLKGRAAPSDPVIPQALRFPKSKWTYTKVKKWVKDHNIKYVKMEPAKGTKS